MHLASVKVFEGWCKPRTALATMNGHFLSEFPLESLALDSQAEFSSLINECDNHCAIIYVFLKDREREIVES